MKMSVNVSVCSLSLLLLLECVRAEPAADLQTLKRMLVEGMNGAAPFHHHLSQVEVEEKEKDAFTDKSLFAAPEQQRPWDSSEPGNSALAAGKESVLARLLKDLMRTSKRSWSRYKKGGQRSCFGVRLERIGSFSGLGC